ncbi:MULTISPECIES: type II toxin-antitoxin system death-on-curing family toxin [unclassified Nocardioides]|uniref:type II toxin-antitoxin system death-on-curing family toxin n=1 Tax=unclassified Nocardioides TaxID=2615069 RepID=UPI000056F8E0|nr:MULTISPECIES: type II toxin-antitoxin system death-on-curing family toxin [unclassified Nocardioides]ABL83160.1 death-on-curing family protein [Nocardioides sp. JS614]
MTVLLTVEDLLSLVADLGVGPVRDVGLLDSAAHRPGAVLYGHEAYQDVDRKAAALLDSLVGNHALVDGNKRLGWLAVVVFYGLNGVDLGAPDDPAFELVMSVARREAPLDEIAATLVRWH